MRPSFVEITSRLSKLFNIDDVPNHPPAGPPPQPSPPTLIADEAAATPADAPATAPAPATAAAAAADQAAAPDTSTWAALLDIAASTTSSPAAAATANPATTTMPVTNVDGCSSDEMLMGSAPCVFSHCSSRLALASCWDVNTANSQLLRSHVQDGHHPPTQAALISLPGTNGCLLDSGVTAHLAHACDEQRLQPGPGGAVQQHQQP